jgi:mannose-6-phosphate isomerase-like protein (cupin superfamily)
VHNRVSNHVHRKEEAMSSNASGAQPVGTIVLGPDEGRSADFGGFGARFLIDGATSGGGFALVEHPLAPRTLAAPLHVHEREDEYSFVLEAEIGFQVGDEIRYARPGDLVFKPRGVWHAFWNRTDAPARLLEIISPAGFERYFEEIEPLLPPSRDEPDFAGLAAVMERYRLRMDFESIATISAREGLPLP